jgi:diguanylate cyclase (GGDEF)-like protein
MSGRRPPQGDPSVEVGAAPEGAAAVSPVGSERSEGPPVPADEDRRLRTLSEYDVMDSERDARFESLVAEIARDCGVPIATITFVDATRQWFKASIGIDLDETARNDALCAYTILDPDRPMVIPDTTRDPRFRENPYVVGDPGLMAYAGAPIVAPDGTVMGTVCAMDLEPRDYSPSELAALERASRRVIELLEDGRIAERLATGETVETLAQGLGAVPAERTGPDPTGPEQVEAEHGSATARDPSLDLTRPLIEAIGEDLDVVALVEQFCQAVLSTFGWWAARVAWVQGDNLQPGAWQVGPGSPAAFAPLDGRPAGPTALDDLSVSYAEAALLDVSMLRCMSDRDVLTSLGARHAVVIDVPGTSSLAARLIFLVPTARALDGAADRTLTTATAVLPRVIVQQRARQELTYRATHDSLTGLLNREGLQRVYRMAETAGVHRRALLYLDVDGFKQINDTQGHRAGDELLIRMGRLLTSHVRPTDTVTRLGGDEFVIVLEGIEDDEELTRVARRLLRSLCGPLTLLRTIRVDASVSIGGVRWSSGPLDQALEVSDRLMYSAKELGGARAAIEGAAGRSVLLAAGDHEPSDLDQALDGAVDVRTAPIVETRPDGTIVQVGVRGRIASSLRHPDVSELAATLADDLLGSTAPVSMVRIELSRELWEMEGVAVRLLVALRERIPHVTIAAVIAPEVAESARAFEAVVAVRDGLGLAIVLTGFGTGRGELALLDRLRPQVIELAPDVLADLPDAPASSASVTPSSLPGALVAARALAADRGIELTATSVDDPREGDGDLADRLATVGVRTIAVLPGASIRPVSEPSR